MNKIKITISQAMIDGGMQCKYDCGYTDIDDYNINDMPNICTQSCEHFVKLEDEIVDDVAYFVVTCNKEN